MNSKAIHGRTGRRSVFTAVGMLGVLGLLSATAIQPSDREGTRPVANRYIGASKCKNCHSSDASGNQYGAWKGAKHSHAFEGLATDEAKKAAADLGIADAQKADECLKCHTTAFGEDEKLIKRGFKIEEGVQCETCHGPGEQHMKARFAEAAKGGDEEGFGDEEPGWVALPEGEIIVNPSPEVCLECHNAEAPTFKGFCYYEFVQKVSHLDPRKERPEAEKVACTCGHPEGHTCTEACVEKGG